MSGRPKPRSTNCLAAHLGLSARTKVADLCGLLAGWFTSLALPLQYGLCLSSPSLLFVSRLGQQRCCSCLSQDTIVLHSASTPKSETHTTHYDAICSSPQLGLIALPISLELGTPLPSLAVPRPLRSSLAGHAYHGTWRTRASCPAGMFAVQLCNFPHEGAEPVTKRQFP